MTSRQPDAYTVSAITRMIKGALEERFQDIWIEGEISGYHHHSSGHRYFQLKDEQAVIKVTLWKSLGATLKFEPTDGQKVLIFGDVTVYERGGNYQFNCRKLVPAGVGELELAFQQLHARLSAEGMFDDDRKREIPRFPAKIGIVTSPTGAAIEDIMQIARRRNRSVELIIYPAQVQGKGAEEMIAAGIRYFNRLKRVDLLIVGRGGGSQEDLWAFNTEVVVRAIVSSAIPVISAVGHETDTTLSDLAADLRAPTPSAAAELAFWSRQDALAQIASALRSQRLALSRVTEFMAARLVSLARRAPFYRPLDRTQQESQRLDLTVRTLAERLNRTREMMEARLDGAISLLDALSPMRILARGYSVTRLLPEKTLLKSISGVHTGTQLETLLADGTLCVRVEQVRDNKTT